MATPSAAPPSASDLAGRIARGDRLDIVGPPASGRTRTLDEVAGLIARKGKKPVVLRVSPTIDKVEHGLLALATEIGADCISHVDEVLERAPADLAGALAIIANHLGARPLFVDDADNLEPPTAADDLHWMFRGPASELARFIGARAILRVTTMPLSDAEPRASIPFASIEDEPWSAPIDLHVIRQHVGTDAVRLRIALSRAVLHFSETGDQFREASWARWTESAILEDVWRLADPAVRDLLRLLAAHVRPIHRAILEELGVQEDVIRRAGASRVIEESGSQVWLGRIWLPWITKGCDLRESHDRLARSFERRADGIDVGRHVAMVEAFRHYVAADEDLSRARRFLRHGVASLLERAHDLSAREQRWKPAARLYREVLDLDERLRKETGASNPIGPLPRAYAKHYWHYNLYKDDSESIERTEAGYAKALEDWRTNALFWSRLVVTKLVAEKWGDAFATLAKAKEAVPSPRARDRRLIERTTRKLIERSSQQPALAVAALAIWQDHQPDDPIQGESTARALEAALIRGAATAFLPARKPVVFHVPVCVRFTKANGVWACNLEEIDVTGRATSPIEAFERAAAQLRDDTSRCLTTPTHTLDGAGRERKRVLLGRVDVVASEITSDPEPETWVLARVERRPGGGPVVRTLDGALLDTASADIPDKRDEDDLWLVRVATEGTGAPSTTVVKFEEALTGAASDDIWRRWADRWQHHA